MKIKIFKPVIFNVICLLLLSPTLAKAGLTLKIVDINNEPVENVIVYLLPLEGQKFKNIKMKSLQIDQRDKKFSPFVSVIRKGVPLTFVNKDSITHQIYSASSTNRFSFRIKSGAEKKIKGLTIGKVLMGCNIHDWMSGYLLVLDTPLYAKTNFNGESHLDVTGVGRYMLVAWHPQLGEENQKISQEIVLGKDQYIRIKLMENMKEISRQESPDSFDFLEDY